MRNQSNHWLENNFGDKYLVAINPHDFQHGSAKVVFEQNYLEDFVTEKLLYLCIGTDSGLLIDYVASQLQPTSQCIFIELNQVYDQINAEGLLNDLPKNICVTTYDSWFDVAKEHQIDAYVAHENYQLKPSLAAVDCHEFQYKLLERKIETELIQYVWQERSFFYSQNFIIQQLMNAPLNQIPASVFKNSLAGKQAVLLAGGPSLDVMLPWVIENRDKVCLVAVSRISRRLLDVGVTPDIVVAIDPTEKMYQVSCEMLLFEPKPMFVSGFHVNNKLQALWSGPQVYLGQRLPWQSEFDQDNIAARGPTVTNAAIEFLVATGIRQLFLIGADLAYSQSGHTHAKGSREFNQGPKLDFLGHRVELNNGEHGETDPAFYSAIEMLGEQATEAIENGCEIINLSPCAAKITNVKFLPHQEVVFDKKLRSINDIIQVKTTRTVGERIQSLKTIKNTLQLTLKRFDDAIKISQQCLRLNQQDESAQQKISHLENKLENKHSDLLKAIKIYAFRDFIDVYDFGDGDYDLDRVQKLGDVYFKAYASGGKKIRKLVLNSIKFTELLIQEFNAEQPPLQEWQKFNLKERIIAWPILHKKHYEQLSSEQQSECNQQITNLQKKLQQPLPSTSVAPKIDQHMIRLKIDEMYRYQDIAELQNYVTRLDTANLSELEALRLFAIACHAELNNDLDTAMPTYFAAAEAGLAEASLNHLAGLLLKRRDYPNALFALEALCDVNPLYFSQLARFYEACQEDVKACQSYEQYFNTVKSDKITAALYQECQNRSRTQS